MYITPNTTQLTNQNLPHVHVIVIKRGKMLESKAWLVVVEKVAQVFLTNQKIPPGLSSVCSEPGSTTGSDPGLSERHTGCLTNELRKARGH